MDSRRANPLLLYLPATGRGGCERYALQLTAHARGRVVHIVLPRLDGLGGLRREFESMGAVCHGWPPLEEVKRGSWPTPARQREAMTELLGEIRPSSALLALPWPTTILGVAEALAAADVPTVAVFQLCVADARLPARAVASAATSTRLAQRWVAASRDAADNVERLFGLPAEAVLAIPNGVEIACLPSRARRSAIRVDVRRELGLPLDARLVIGVGRKVRQKGIDLFVATANRLAARGLRPFFVWCGDGTDAPLLEGAAGRSVLFLGYRTDIQRLLAAADVFLFPSRYECTSFALLEAMSAELPIVATDIPGTRDVLRDAVDGTLVAPESADGMADAVAAYLADRELTRCHGRAARRRLRSGFDIVQVVHRTLGLLDELESASGNGSGARV
jgi:glycosyltransferase involved in cell wall biosynthesis